MHERRVVTTLADAVARAAGEAVARITEVELVVGALAPFDAAALEMALGDAVRERWGVTPRVVVGVADGADALSDEVRLVGLTVGG